MSTVIGSEFHVPGQNYGAQPGPQVGGGGGSIGVPGGRGPSLPGIPPIGQSTTGIQPGGPAGGQQQPPQVQTPGVQQQQQSQGPTPTTTPPVHTPSPQDMGKQAHLQSQSPSLQGSYVPHQSRPGFYQMASRPQQPRGLGHRGNQGGNAPHVVGMPGSAGQPTAMYPQHPNISVPSAPMFLSAPVIHGGPQHQVYSMNNQMPQIYTQQQRHQPHHGQQYYSSFPSHAILPNVYQFPPGQPQPQYYYSGHHPNTTLNLNRASANTVSGGGQNVGGPLAGAQGTAGVPQGSLQQPTQQPQTIPSMAISLTQPAYAGHNGGTPNPISTYQKVTMRPNALLDIVDPETGINVASEIYRNAASTPSDDTKNREIPQPQSSAIIAEFASRVAKAASETSTTNNSAPTTSVQEHIKDQASSTTTTASSVIPTPSQSLTNLNPQPISSNDPPVLSQCNIEPVVPTPTNIVQTTNVSLPQLTAQVESCPVKTESKPLTAPVKKSWPRNETKPQTPIEEPIIAVPNKDNIPIQQSPGPVPPTESASSYSSEISFDATAAAASVPEVTKEQQERTSSEKSLNPREQTEIHLQKNGETVADKIEPENKEDSKSADGKNMQKQKSKNKLKGRDINRKGAEKEGSEMDAFVNVVPQPGKPEVETQSLEINDALPAEISLKEKESTEVKPDAEVEQISQDQEEKLKKSEIVDENVTNVQSPIVEMPVKNHKESAPTIEDSNKSEELPVKRENDVVDHANVKDVIDVEALVAQKNEENNKVSGTGVSTEEKTVESVNEKQNENEPPNQTETTTKISAPKYTYNDYQWSPINKEGKKMYDIEFLMKLQDDPQSRMRPPNLPELDVVRKPGHKQTPRSTTDHKMIREFRNSDNILLPGFAKSSFNSKMGNLLPGSKKSYQGNKKPSKPNVIHVTLSLREDVKLRESENAWKPTRVKSENLSEDEAKSQALYKKVRSVLNKLTPQKFDTLVNQVRTLDIDTHERLQGVIDLVFLKAIDEPNFSVAYALMCKELGQMQVAGGNKKSGTADTKQQKEDQSTFRKLILIRCQYEFENNAVDDVARAAKLKEIEECTEPEKKKELQLLFDDDERRLRMKSVGNIRFIGELFKLDMIRVGIMNQCINHLLKSPDEDNLECLCKLLTTIGKTLEKNKHDLSQCFTELSNLARNKHGGKKISSRIRFMIQDVIDLRAKNWVPRRDEGNPKTMDQVVKDAESERLDIELNNSGPMNTPRKDDRMGGDRRRINHRPGGNANSGMDDGWNTIISKVPNRQYSVESSKFNAAKEPQSHSNLILGNKNQYLWGSGSGSSIPPRQSTMSNKYAVLDNISSMDHQDKRVPQIPLPGSRSTGATRDYRPEYKAWEGRGSRNGGHQLNSSSSFSRSDSRESSMESSSRSQSMSMPPPQTKYKPPSTPVTSTSNKPSSSSSSSSLTETNCADRVLNIIQGFRNCPNVQSSIDSAMDELGDTFPASVHSLFLRTALNAILDKSEELRKRTAALFAHMLHQKLFSLSLFHAEYNYVLKIASDLVLDVPKLWQYTAEILMEMITRKAYPLSELKNNTEVLKPVGAAGELVGQLLSLLAKDQGPIWVAEKWQESGLQWNDLIDPSIENVDEIVKKFNLEFLTKGYNSSELSTSECDLTPGQIQSKLEKLMRESTFENITSWVSKCVGSRSNETQFIRALMTAILEVSIELSTDHKSYKLNSVVFKSQLPLITRYVDTEPELELQCLYAIQAHHHKLQYSLTILANIIDIFCACGIISDDAFLSWEQSTNPAEMQGHGVVMKALTSFFVNLRETTEDSCEEA